MTVFGVIYNFGIETETGLTKLLTIQKCIIFLRHLAYMGILWHFKMRAGTKIRKNPCVYQCGYTYGYMITWIHTYILLGVDDELEYNYF